MPELQSLVGGHLAKGRRPRWVIVPPVMSLDKALEEIHFGKNHGACGVYLRGVEGDRRLSDPYFYPLYEEASKLNLPICIHASSGNFAMFDLYSSDSGFAQFKLTVVGAFHDLLLKGTPEKFKDLRWAFIEVSSERVCLRKVPSWYSRKVARNSSWVFITMVPRQATGSPRGLPATSKKRTGCCSVVTVMLLPKPWRTRLPVPQVHCFDISK